ncbi:MAG: amino acid permease, partial [Bacteroidetes bacterium]|nr:amino acid permease [Bacteroidota bacterium]
MAKSLVNTNAKFGTMPVFLTALSTILGAILFLRFGWAVGQVGFLGVIGIIILGHVVTIPTAFAVAEIATNQRVQGGGAYYIISRSFGLNIGGAIGIALYLSQAISVAFYVIAFGEAFEPVINWLSNTYDFHIPDRRWISIPTMILLSLLILTKGANFGMKALYFVVAILLTSLVMFFMGDSPIKPTEINFHAKVPDNVNFFFVFTIIFPAFTGLAAGLGLSGDLKNPQKSIPQGTLWATIVGMLVYIAIAYKFAISATPEDMVSDQLIMSKIAIWGPIIPIGLAAASLSSALGSIIVAPRTLQAIGFDDIFPQKAVNRWFAKGKEKDNEPVNGSLITIIIAFV